MDNDNAPWFNVFRLGADPLIHSIYSVAYITTRCVFSLRIGLSVWRDWIVAGLAHRQLLVLWRLRAALEVGGHHHNGAG